MEMTPFALAALVLIMMPGPDQALITRNALVGGRRGGLLTIVGGVAGLSVHASAAAVGLSALLVASATAFTVLKVVGACYLLWLAVQMLRSAARSRREPEDGAVSPRPLGIRSPTWARASCRTPSTRRSRSSSSRSCRSSCPPTPAPRVPRRCCCRRSSRCLYLAWFGLYVAAVDRLGRWLRRPSVKARIEQVTGVVLLGVAVRLATAPH